MIKRLSLEHPLVQHCNLRCVNCDHGSPLSPKHFSNLETFQRDITSLATCLSVNTLKLVGGEPLLHPEFREFLAIARESAISDRVQLWTNGLLLHKLAPGDLNDCDDLIISSYPGVRQRWQNEAVKALSERATFRVFVKHPTHFLKVDADPGARDSKTVTQTYLECKNAHEWSCHSFIDGFYYKCSRSQFLNQSLPPNPNGDGVPIRDVTTISIDLMNYINDPTPLAACSSCLGTSGPLEPHRQAQGVARAD